ncbi:hypothetical protein MACH07_21330 [Flagellimonas marinaquae]|uniref:DUF5117 domain-containing protein n=2 Tax=Flagellimonas marinaquae TaxID=254955 RepID=A0AA48I055_9FLAO|nr:hypothetical protein MACH07_21330 [Allomuricauda aquimarina]
MKAIDMHVNHWSMKRIKSMGMLPFLFTLFFELAACPLMGQANNGIQARLENDRLFLDVQDELLDKPLLLVRYGKGYQQVVWSKQQEYLILKVPRVQSLVGTMIPVNQDYKIEGLILERFPIVDQDRLEDGYRVDATALFLSTEIKWYRNFVEETAVPGEGFVEKVFNLEGETIVQTRRTVDRNGNRKTIIADFSLFHLPEPMRPRLFDPRMGYFVEDIKEGGHLSGSISRWRLAKKDSTIYPSDPIKPITFYFGPKVPDTWKSYIKAGILEWLPAFEAAGFTNAIEVKELPEDITKGPRHSMERSMIKWEAYSGIRGAEDRASSTVDTYVDFRSGEILKADIVLASSYQNLSDNYFVRCAPLDKRAQHYPFPDDLLGELIQSVTAHEAGHAFGLRDGNYGEFAYPFEKMRDREWLKTMGHTPSAMTYARHNFIAQPEDSISPSLLIQRVGPMDSHQIQWGYMLIPGTNGPYEEIPELERIIKIQDTVPWYRFNLDQYKPIGPNNVNEVVDNNDPVRTANLGLKNLERVMELLPQVHEGRENSMHLERLYTKTVELWYHEMAFVMSLIGGFEIQLKTGVQEGGVYKPIDSNRQMEAMVFLGEHAFEVPDWLAAPEFSDRLYHTTNDDVLLEKQLTLLSETLGPFRMKRMELMERSTYKGMSKWLLAQLMNNLFKEMNRNSISICERRQKLQRAYIKLLVGAILEERRYDRPNARENTYLYSDYSKSLFLGELDGLKKQLMKALKRVGDKTTKAHLKLCLLEMDKVTRYK